MRYILFGAGVIGVRAMKILGGDLIECFADNFKYGSTVCGKKVISFDEMLAVADQFCIMITSNDYIDELEKQLLAAGIANYVIFNRRFPEGMCEILPAYDYLHNAQYMNYTDILLNYQIEKYNKIAVYGVNKFTDYLLLEIGILNDLKNVLYIIEPDIDCTEFRGIPVVKLDDARDKIDCLIINKRRTESGIREEVDDDGFDIIDIYDVDKFVFHNMHPELGKYKDIHKGKRIFIIGNGPSLTTADLDVLHENGEICFALNKIHKIFPQTAWRPDYIGMTDTRPITACEDELDIITENSILFMEDKYINTNTAIEDKLQYVHLKFEQYAPNLPGFSDDITKGVFWGCTVTYDFAIQIAAYMGFGEMYLIGMDHHNVGAATDARNHFIKDYFTQEETGLYKNVIADFGAMELAYKKAENYSRKHGFRIYNATRGGKLEIFERVDFDSLFEKGDRR